MVGGVKALRKNPDWGAIGREAFLGGAMASLGAIGGGGSSTTIIIKKVVFR